MRHNFRDPDSVSDRRLTPVFLLRYLLERPSRWKAASQLFLAFAFRTRDTFCSADGVTLKCGLRNGQGLWCAVSGLDYEPALPAFLNQLKHGQTVVTLGANIGTYALRAAKRVGPKGRVIAFEPLPINLQRLRDAISRNQFQNVQVIPCAAGDTEGKARFAVSGRESSATMVLEESDLAEMEVDVVTVDQVMDRLGIEKVHWVQMDIEGAEPMAIQGMMKTIETSRPNILFENGGSGEEAITLLKDLGYSVGRFDKDGSWEKSVKGDNLFALASERPCSA